MKDYKRQKNDLEARLSELSKKCKHHDDHIRTVDAWFAQLLDEIRSQAVQTLPAPTSTSDEGEGDLYKSALLFEDNALFSEHLRTRSSGIRAAISDIFSRFPPASPEAEDYRRQINSMLAAEKGHAVELRQALDDVQSLTERLESASYRYMTAEKKLDRVKSTQVQKLERAAIMGGNVNSTAESSSPIAGSVTKKGTPPVKREDGTNGDTLMENGISSPTEASLLREETLAAASVQKSHLLELEAENTRLTNELSAARTKYATLSSDDYATTPLFQTLKAQYDDVVARVNTLEATNVTLREEAQRLQSERTGYRFALDEEMRERISENEAQIARAETDLVRIRGARDEFAAELTVRRAADEGRQGSAEAIGEMADAREERIRALESEISRLKLRLGDASPTTSTDLDENDGLTPDDLRAKLRQSTAQHALLSNELTSMELAWRKTSVLAAAKVATLASSSEALARAQAEKAKAEQKYFAAMKAKDMREAELRELKKRDARSAEMVNVLKEGERGLVERVGGLERTVAEAREVVGKYEVAQREVEAKAKVSGLEGEGLRKQVEELKVLTVEKEAEALEAGKRRREAETELARVGVRLEEARKTSDALRKSQHADNSASSDDWRVRLTPSLLGSKIPLFYKNIY